MQRPEEEVVVGLFSTVKKYKNVVAKLESQQALEKRNFQSLSTLSSKWSITQREAV